MGTLQSELQLVAERQPENLTEFCKYLPLDWILEALMSTGMASLRRRRLPAEFVVWLVIGIALFRNRSIVGVQESLGLDTGGKKLVARSAVSKARARLGPEPVKWLCYRMASEWSHEEARKDRFHGRPLYGLDGVTMKVADTKENREAFGGPSNSAGACAHPVIRAVCLLTVRARLLAGASFGTYHQHEQLYAKELWHHLPKGSLCLFDKGLYAAATACRLIKSGSDFLCRLPSSVKYEVIGALGKDDRLVRITLSDNVRRENQDLPESFVARLIRTRAPRRTRKDGGSGQKGAQAERQYLLTSLVDPAISADELRELYKERWELENAYDEVKTEVLEREETLRSKSPEMVEQELWGILIAYNLIRIEMTRAAVQAKVSPTRISFVSAFTYIRDEFVFLANAAPGAIPKQLKRMREDVGRMVLPARRQRHYPRVVKAGRTRYPVKRERKTRRAAPSDDKAAK